MKQIINKQAKEIYERHLKFTEKNEMTEEKKEYLKRNTMFVEYLIDVYENNLEDTTILQNIFPSFEYYQNVELFHFRKPLYWLRNEHVSTCFSFFQKTFLNSQELTIERIQAGTCMDITSRIASLYEIQMVLDEEDVNKMFEAYDEHFRPVFPEEVKK